VKPTLDKPKMKSEFINKEIRIPVKLTDQNSMYGSISRQAIIKASPLGIEIFVEGYGTAGMEDGFGAPIFIEFYEGKLRVVLNPDINVEDPEIIEMQGALEQKREAV